jgi:hypothetical protein
MRSEGPQELRDTTRNQDPRELANDQAVDGIAGNEQRTEKQITFLLIPKEPATTTLRPAALFRPANRNPSGGTAAATFVLLFLTTIAIKVGNFHWRLYRDMAIKRQLRHSAAKGLMEMAAGL